MVELKYSSKRIMIFTLLLLFVCVFLINNLDRYEEPVVAQTGSLIGFNKNGINAFYSIETIDGFHQYSSYVSLVPNTNYRIQYDISRLPRNKIIATTDFYAPGYDSPEQEVAQVLGMYDLKRKQNFVFNSKRSPENALLRVFYTGSPGLEIKNLKIMRIPIWLTYAKRGLASIVLGLLLVIAVLGYQELRKSYTLLRMGEVTGLGKFISEGPVLIAIYFVAVFIRYVMYIAMPYWSGDEYVYKSIAAGIWTFGRHGILTDAMIANTVSIPNQLYPYLIAPAFALSEDFYFGLRLINSIVMNLAIFPCYLIARKFLDRKSALFAATLSISIPFANIGAFAVSEVLFFPLFLFCIWVALESFDRPRPVAWFAGFGVLVAILLNVRLNAVVLFPAYFVSIIWVALKRNQWLLLFRRPYWIIALVSFLISYIFIQHFIGALQIGEMGVYDSVVEIETGSLEIIFNDPGGFINLIAGHLTTISIPYALPIAFMFLVLFSSHRWPICDKKFETFIITSLIFSVSLFVLALLFTIRVSQVDLGGLGRWHSRYYFYFYPLIIIAGVAFASCSRYPVKTDKFIINTIVGVFLVAGLYFIKFHGGQQIEWFGSIADNMDVQWYKSARKFYWFFVAFSIFLTWIWCYRNHQFYKLFSGFIIIWAIVANYGVMKLAGVGTNARLAQQVAMDTTIASPCGKLAYQFLESHPGLFSVIGDSRGAIVDAAFWNPYIPESTFIGNEIPLAISTTGGREYIDYLIVNGDVHVDDAYLPMVTIGKCFIYAAPKYTADQ